MTPLILTLDVSGYPFGWMTWKEAIAHQVAGRVARNLGGYRFTFYGGHCRRSGNRSSVTITSIMALRGRNPFAWRNSSIALSNAALFHRDRYTCAYCGKRSNNGVHLTRDHIIPRCRGGEDVWGNVTSACLRCNAKKNDKTPEEAGMELLFVPYTPSLHEGLLLQNRRILADQMEMLHAMLPKHSRLFRSS